ncbi:FliI/YscN family ATPase [Aestuariibius insulae]|uniref:FliI/YscN family ATPase n=1 Tax=Aestuariibius insulae TaxID=2058287 RepID=UPI00398EE21C
MTTLVPRATLRQIFGEVIEISGPIIRAALQNASIGALCKIDQGDGQLLAEVIGVSGPHAILSPFSSMEGLKAHAPVRLQDSALTIPVGSGLLGRVIDAFGEPIDASGPVTGDTKAQAVRAAAPCAASRPLIDTKFATGLRAIDGILTLGRGQRIGLFGPPGAGKSTLLAAIARYSEADVIVIGLVGERGREVREFTERELPADKRRKVVVVTATSDRSPVERALCAQSATAVAERFRDEGKSVLLLIDSLTRTARALREIGLAAGEPPTRRGYPASVYPALPALIERAGRSEVGDITAIYTVLIEGDGEGDPIAEEVRSLTDGHVMLSPALAAAGHYPAIDISASLSRIMSAVTAKDHQDMAIKLRRHLTKYKEIEILLQVGEYKAGGDRDADAAVSAKPRIDAFLRQSADEKTVPSELIEQLGRAI